MSSDKVKIVVGDNLASHFSHAVIKASQKDNIYITLLSPNLTHIMQPLDVSMFAPIKRNSRQILDWPTTSRIRGNIPKVIYQFDLGISFQATNKVICYKLS